MEMSSQFNVPAALFQGKDLSVPIKQGIERASEPVWIVWRREKSPALQRLEPRVFYPIAWSLHRVLSSKHGHL